MTEPSEEAYRLAKGQAGALWLALSLVEAKPGHYEARTEDGKVTVELHPYGVRVTGPSGERNWAGETEMLEVLLWIEKEIG